jgi:hypothetical protein
LCVSDNSGQRAGNQSNLQHIHFVLHDLRCCPVGSPVGGLRGSDETIWLPFPWINGAVRK